MLLPEIAIDGWRSWDAGLRERPDVLGPLSGGRSNQSFLLASGGRKFVLRLNAADTLLPGSSRGNETNIWEAASQAGIAPPMLFADADNGFLVSLYIENSVPAEPPYPDACMWQASDLLRRCHELDVTAPSIDYAAHVEYYWQIIEHKNRLANPALLEQREPMKAALATLVESDTPVGLCHHDPVVANFVGNAQKLYLIDWEYAAIGLQVMDYAALGVEWGMCEASLHEKTGLDADTLRLAGDFYRYLCDLWQET